jgi:hypothetical protein
MGKNDRENARRYADMADDGAATKGDLLLSVLQGEELLRQAQAAITYALVKFELAIIPMLRAREFTDAEKIHILKQEIKLHECVYEDGDFGFKHTRMTWLNLDIARLYANAQDAENTLQHLGEAVRHARIYDKMEPRTLHSPLMEGYVYDPKILMRNYEGTEIKMISQTLAAPAFDFLRDDPRFIALL